MRKLGLLLLALAGSLWSYGQSVPVAFEPQNFHQQRIAHRGGYAYGPENTLETICQNIRTRGIEAMEIDLRLTSDGYLVLFHDETTGRILETDRDVPVGEMTLQEIQSYPLRDRRLGEVHVTEFSRLVDTLMVLVYEEGRKFMLELDFKPHNDETAPAVRMLMSGIQQRGAQIGDTLFNYFFISTFYPEVLKEVRKYSEKPVLAFSVNHDPTSQVFLARLAVMLSPHFARKYHCAIIEPNACWLSSNYVRRWTRKGYAINAYTANSACEKEFLEQLHIAYTTNCPDSTCNDDPSDMMVHKRKWCKGCH